MNWKFYFNHLIIVCALFILSCSGDDSPEFMPNFGDAPSTPNLFDLSNLINDLREDGHDCSGTSYDAAPELTFNFFLNQIAREHAEYMDSIDVLTHIGRNNAEIGDRAIEGGYNYTIISENLAKGYADEASVIDAWKNSDGHCDNMMNPDVNEMGVGTSGAYWVMVFGVE